MEKLDIIIFCNVVCFIFISKAMFIVFGSKKKFTTIVLVLLLLSSNPGISYQYMILLCISGFLHLCMVVLIAL